MTAAARPQPDTLPGELLMWVLILSELLVFGAGFAVLLGLRLTDPPGFAAAQLQLDQPVAAANTALLITSGWLAARGLAAARSGAAARCRISLLAAALLGCGFLILKAHDYAALADQGIGMESHPFFTFFFLLTGFHAAHVAAGILLLIGVAWSARPAGVEVATAFWHMVDLIWVLLLPVVYLL